MNEPAKNNAQNVPKKEQPKEQPLVVRQLMSDSFKKQIMLALPKHLDADRMTRIALTELRRTPKLMQCDSQSFLGSVIQCSQLGLEPGNSLGHAYLLPYNNRKEGTVECQLIIGYRGMIELARRSGQIISISAQAVRENDFYKVRYGLNSDLDHVPVRLDRGEIIAFYAIAKLKDGGHQFENLWKNEVDIIRSSSKASQSGPWVTHYEEMGRKTVIRRLFKYLPVSVELQKAITLDEEAEEGIQSNGYLIDGDFEVTNTEEEQKPATKADAVANKLEAKKTKPSEEPSLLSPEEQKKLDESWQNFDAGTPT